MAWQVNGILGCVLSLLCFVVQLNITRPYLCANHLAPPYLGLPASAAEAPSEAPPPQSAAGAAGEGYGAGALILMLFVVHMPLWHTVRKLAPTASFSFVEVRVYGLCTRVNLDHS